MARIEYTPLPPIPETNTEQLQTYLQNELIRLSQFVGEATDEASSFSTGDNNLLINGGFDFWQRGTSFTKTGSIGPLYTADRWSIEPSFPANIIAASKQTLGTFYTVTELAGKDYLQFQSFSVAGGGLNTLRTTVENIVPLLGRTLTLSFYSNTDGGIGDTFSLVASANFGAGGSPVDFVLDETVTMTSIDLAKYTYTFNVTEANGKTVGDGSYLEINFNTDKVQLINIAQVKLELGDTATPFIPRPLQQELALCQRYYNTNTGTIAMTAGRDTTRDLFFTWPVTMRVAPSVTVGSADTVPTTIQPSVNGVRLSLTVANSSAINRVNEIIADAEF